MRLPRVATPMAPTACTTPVRAPRSSPLTPRLRTNSLTALGAVGKVSCPRRANAPKEDRVRGQYQIRHQADEAEREASTAKSRHAKRDPLHGEGRAHGARH